jgi:hypothetical protein
VPRFYPPASLEEHCLVWHGFQLGKTVTDQTHHDDHTAHDQAVQRLTGPAGASWGQLSAVLPIGHPYAEIGEQEAMAA